MTWLAWLASTRIGRALGALVGAVLAFVVVYLLGRRDERQDAAQDAAEDYTETRKRIDEAVKPSDPDAAREWLRERQSNRDM